MSVFFFLYRSSFKIVTNNMINNRATDLGEKDTLTLTKALLKGITTLDQVTNNVINNRATDVGVLSSSFKIDQGTLTNALLKGTATLDQVTNNMIINRATDLGESSSSFKIDQGTKRKKTSLMHY